ncbi:MAG TPA: hypothetical protein VFK40_02935 [Nitrososphaeraceae archaeon]|nr:hypothetical protein [Nitrososphaeraceae archaeon]
MKERLRFEQEILDLRFDRELLEYEGSTPSSTFKRCIVEIPKKKFATIGFEFDLNYGASPRNPPPNHEDYSLNYQKISLHTWDSHGFRLEGDGNRIEIATKPFELSPAGENEMNGVINKILEFVEFLKTECKKSKPEMYFKKNKKYDWSIGYPTHFELLPELRIPEKEYRIFPLQRNPPPYYRKINLKDKDKDQWTFDVDGSPQATLIIPLSKIDNLVTLIKESETGKKTINGHIIRPLSGNMANKGYRPGVKSQALYDAQIKVNESRKYHLNNRTKLPSGKVVDENNFTATLQGLLILMMSYLRSSEIKYKEKSKDSGKYWDYEPYAKSYLPINVKNPFRLLYRDLTKDEKEVFEELYHKPNPFVPLTMKIFKLATNKKIDEMGIGFKPLFPKRVHIHQKAFFKSLPTWNNFIDNTVHNIPLKRTSGDSNDEYKKCHSSGDEILFAPITSIIPYETGSRRVAIELRRLGYSWLSSDGWKQLLQDLFTIARDLNK